MALAQYFYPFDELSPLVVRRFEIGIEKKDVLRLKVGMRQLVVVQKLDRMNELISHVPNVFHRIRVVVVVLHKIKRQLNRRSIGYFTWHQKKVSE